MIISKPYDESTASDFKELFVARFPDGDLRIPELVLTNPARTGGFDTGSVAYDEKGGVAAIHGLFSRNLFLGRQPMKATCGVALAVRKNGNRDFLTSFIRDSILASGADIFFANTSIPGSRKRGAAALNMEDGPASCAEIRERELRSNGILARLVRKFGKLLGLDQSARSAIAPYSAEISGLTFTYETAINACDFNSFWERYLEANEGLVTSRTAQELQWMFGRGLGSGEVVLLSARKEGLLQGYAFLRRTDASAVCWRIVDLIALKNDTGILELLVDVASRFLRRRTRATCLQVTGFPVWVQPLLKRLFPASSSFGFNKCIWAFLNEKAKALCGDWVNADQGWYGCPYDGDMCLV